LSEFWVSLVVTFAAAPFVRRLMLNHGVVDVPNHRSSHSVPTPLGGGLACLTGVAVALFVAQLLSHEVPWVLIGGAVILAAVGFADDHGGLSAIPRLGAQIAVGAVMGYSVGGGWWFLIAVLVVPVSVNAINFMDGINGITSLSVGLWGLTAVVVGSTHNIGALVVIGAVVAGATVGFLPWNAPLAKLFLGDVGSYLLGGLVSAGILLGVAHGAPIALLIAPLSLYVVDTGTVLVKRLLKGKPLLEAHRDHVYQRLVSRAGMPHIMVACFTVALALVITLAWVPGSAILGVPVTLVVAATYLVSPLIIARIVDPYRQRTSASI
jgi:UDP-N-acetylmuramyl pentapeptide phosphotransferase/UDP-N-acetylglucosamine-1-phosphate transferase